MIKLIVFLAMILMHIENDFVKQGVLAQFKQKKWWEENYPDKLYKYDYIMALAIHSLHWSIYVHIPVLIYHLIYNNSDTGYIVTIVTSIIGNTIMHMIVDHDKANKKYLNLFEDQIFHLLQIIFIFALLILS